LGTPGQNSIADRAGLCSDGPAGVQGAETDMDMAYVAAFLGGLLVFFATHLFSAFRRRDGQGIVGAFGAGPYKGLYSLLTLAGFIALVWGYANIKPWILLADPPSFMRHIAMALMIPAMILIVAAYVPTGFIKKAVKHPMLTAVKIWALAHLLVNWDVGSLVLFGSFLAFGVIDRIAAKKRGDVGAAEATPNVLGDLISLAVGLALYGVLVYELHYILFGIDLYA
jgi:uncharacterized membrane protein